MAEAQLADVIVLFGGTGDLAQRMLFPSLYFLDLDGFLPEGLRIVATARAQLSRDAFVTETQQAVQARSPGGTLDEATWRRFAGRLDYVAADATSAEGVQA